VLDLVEAAQIALREERRLAFVVVGDGPYRGEIEAACAERGVRAAFRFTGWVGHDEVPRLINAADIVAMPSAGEAQALIYLETQACGRTLIASDIPAALEVVDHGQNGLLFPAGDAPALAGQILRAARDRKLRERIGSEGRRRVALHSLDRVVEAYDELLRRTARRPRRRP
jgi:glycosyltransferase involved in cell wall biosynthesis